MAGIDHLAVVNVAFDGGVMMYGLQRGPPKNAEDAFRVIDER
jgi:hypothetical protein